MSDSTEEFDLNYRFNIYDIFIAVVDISFGNITIKKGTFLKVTSIPMSGKFGKDLKHRRTDIIFNDSTTCGIFIYANIYPISMPDYYHKFSFDEIIKLKDYRKLKLDKLNIL